LGGRYLVCQQSGLKAFSTAVAENEFVIFVSDDIVFLKRPPFLICSASHADNFSITINPNTLAWSKQHHKQNEMIKDEKRYFLLTSNPQVVGSNPTRRAKSELVSIFLLQETKAGSVVPLIYLPRRLHRELTKKGR